MLKDLVRERLIAAADEIFGLFEGTIASYEEQLRRAREETERQRRQLEAVCKTQIVIRMEDVQQVIGRHVEFSPQLQWGSSSLEPQDPQPSYVKEENLQLLHVKEEKEDPQPNHVEEEVEEVSVIKIALNGTSVERENEIPELHNHSPSGDHCGGPPPDNLLAPLSDSDDIEEPSRSDGDCEGDDKQSTGSEKETTLNKKTPRIHRSRHAPKEHFSCSTCGKTFNTKKILRKHTRTHNGKKNFCCSVCGKAFPQKANVVSHMKTHVGEKPFSCPICNKTFTHKQHKVTHMRTHSGEKSFSCSTCGKAFSQNSHLVSHVKTHAGEGMHSCSLCDRTFSQKASMVRHMKTHAGKKRL